MTQLPTSRHGLGKCPSCQAHIKVQEETSSGDFCGATLTPSTPSDGVLQKTRALATGRGALLAASLLGFSMFTACGDGPNNNEQVQDASVQPAYGIPAEQLEEKPTETEKAADAGAQPPYGIPPDK